MNSAVSHVARQRASGSLLRNLKPTGRRISDGEQQQHRQVEAGERDRVQRRPGGEDRAAAQDQPDLVAFPHRSDGVDDDPPFQIGAADERQQDRGAHVEPVHHRDADQQHARARPTRAGAGFHIRTSHASSVTRRPGGTTGGTTGARPGAPVSVPSRARADGAHHQEHLDHRQHRVEQHEAGERDHTRRSRGSRRRTGRSAARRRWSRAGGRPSATIPAELGGDPGQRQATTGRAAAASGAVPAAASRRARTSSRTAR